MRMDHDDMIRQSSMPDGSKQVLHDLLESADDYGYSIGKDREAGRRLTGSLAAIINLLEGASGVVPVP